MAVKAGWPRLIDSVAKRKKGHLFFRRKEAIMAEEESIPSVKDLASSEPKLRAAAFKAIQEDLQTRQTLTYTQALQIWKGLFVLLYLTPSHPPLPHQKLVTSVGSLTSRSSTPSSKTLIPLTTAFWETISREWISIDSHRMDKYLLLSRFVLRNMFTNILSSSSSSSSSSSFSSGPETKSNLLTTLSTWPLATPDQTPSTNYNKVPEGLRYHVLDCYVDEIEKVVVVVAADSEEMEINEVNVEELRKPVRDLSVAKGVLKNMRKRAKETVEDERWEGWRKGR
ncbi:putative nucleolar protein nop52 variant [Phaeomoniella chlamydospora]|uniref:Putative nucleolar protein nop52 variant n=1 Tax=Phaeomoniella chlamydospora TaxID=158046 RepID=A0A0G2GV39_PHACM|nr:putative nucleolar protein nop52 variant [Phaeomoniella chlamydospora]